MRGVSTILALVFGMCVYNLAAQTSPIKVPTVSSDAASDKSVNVLRTAGNAGKTATSPATNASTSVPCSATAGYIPVFTGTPPVLCNSEIFQFPGSQVEVHDNLVVYGNVDVESSSGFAFSINGQQVLNTTNPGNFFVGGGEEVGSYNTILGYWTGYFNEGSYNTYSGAQAGMGQVVLNVGSNNTYTGYQSGFSSLSAHDDTFIGSQAGYSNTGGFFDAFFGRLAGYSNVDGTANSFYGSGAGERNLHGWFNTFIGQAAGLTNVNGFFNTFIGSNAGEANKTGNANTYLGTDAGGNSTGSNNLMLGNDAGINSAMGNNNIYIGSPGANESNTIRVGTNGTGSAQQNKVFIDPLKSAPVFSSTVTFDLPSGQLGVLVSSRRFKEQIVDMGDSSSKLFDLRPVTFFYKQQYDGTRHQLQYGLIAEEVAEIYPEMVAYDQEGQPWTVNYQALAPMLLNELQKEHTVVTAQQDEMQTQLQQIKAQGQEIETLKLQLQRQNASLQLKNASLEERLTKLESYITTQTKVASDNPHPTAPGANGGLQ